MTPIRATLLVVDGEPLVRWSLRQRFARDRYQVLEAGTPAAAVKQLAAGVDLVLLDYGLPDAGGLAVLRRIKEMCADTPIILMATFPSVESALEAKKHGVYHCVNKPFNLDDVALTVEQALETARLRREVRTLRNGQSRQFGLAAVVGRSPAMRIVKALLARAAASTASSVLMTGEAGTGKHLAAKVIHHNGDRAGHPFASLQPTLLRLLDEQTITRANGTDAQVDVRVVAATSRDLDADVRAGRFRDDLLRRLRLMGVHLPPLRDRAGDVALLSEHYTSRYAQELRKRVRGVAPEALGMLGRYHWPGNMRELRNAIERATLLGERERLGVFDFAGLGRGPATGAFRLPPEGVNLEEVERQLLEQALERCGGNQTHAGRMLGINRDQVRYRVEKFGLSAGANGLCPRSGGADPDRPEAALDRDIA